MKLTRLCKGDVFGEYISEKSTLQIQVNEKVTHLGPKGGSREHLLVGPAEVCGASRYVKVPHIRKRESSSNPTTQ